MKFSKSVSEKLKYYIYLYSDPITNEVFYVGKGKGNRIFEHLTDNSDSKKSKKIKMIKEGGKEPKLEILIHGIKDSETALRIEASIIDLIGKNRLTNLVSGYESSSFGRSEVKNLIDKYEREPADILEPSLLIKINETFRFGMSEIELYDATRGIWKIGEKRKAVDFAMAIYDGIVQEVYSIKEWFPAGTTLTTRNDLKGKIDTSRWEFVGKIADEKIRKKYLGKDVKGYFNNPQLTFTYVKEKNI